MVAATDTEMGAAAGDPTGVGANGDSRCLAWLVSRADVPSTSGAMTGCGGNAAGAGLRAARRAVALCLREDFLDAAHVVIPP
jgi:hypothetical protein